MVPVLEPADAQEALDFTRLAFDLSERFDTPGIVRGTTRLSHTRSQVRVGDREEHPPRGFVEDPTKQVMLPVYARLSSDPVRAAFDALGAYVAEAVQDEEEEAVDKIVHL